eukprot:jgi/Undpi1/10528/HiC_scaffold_29.g12978.m1
MVGGLGSFGFDEAVGYAGEEEQGGRAGFRSREVHDKFAFSHGTFEKVNYLGYDDHVVLNRSLSFLLGEEAAEATAEVGPHHHHDVPSDFHPEETAHPEEMAAWVEASQLLPRQGTKVAPILAKYLAALRYQDLFLERLFKRLDDTGLSENTYVVVVGDHGESRSDWVQPRNGEFLALTGAWQGGAAAWAFGEHGYDKHGNNVYQEGLFVPFSLTGPSRSSRIAPGTRLDRVGMHADIAPTLLDLLGLWKQQHPHIDSLEAGEEEEGEEEEEGGSTAYEGGFLSKQDASKEDDDETLQQDKDGGRGKGGEPLVGAGVALHPGSGLVGDSLLGPDYRGCALGANHYGGKTIAVMAGEWKGLFLYRWERRGVESHAEVVNAQLFNLSEDPQEQQTLLERGGAGGCCLAITSPDQSATIITNPDLSAALEVMATLVDGASQVSTSCLAAAATSAPPQGGGGPGGVVQGEGAFLGSVAITFSLEMTCLFLAGMGSGPVSGRTEKLPAIRVQ